MADEINDPEMSFRRGFQQGAYELFATIEGLLPERERALVRGWVNEDLIEWRIKAMQGQNGRVNGRITAACLPPVGRLASFDRPRTSN